MIFHDGVRLRFWALKKEDIVSLHPTSFWDVLVLLCQNKYSHVVVSTLSKTLGELLRVHKLGTASHIVQYKA